MNKLRNFFIWFCCFGVIFMGIRPQIVMANDATVKDAATTKDATNDVVERKTATHPILCEGYSYWSFDELPETLATDCTVLSVAIFDNIEFCNQNPKDTKVLYSTSRTPSVHLMKNAQPAELRVVDAYIRDVSEACYENGLGLIGATSINHLTGEKEAVFAVFDPKAVPCLIFHAAPEKSDVYCDFTYAIDVVRIKDVDAEKTEALPRSDKEKLLQSILEYKKALDSEQS